MLMASTGVVSIVYLEARSSALGVLLSARLQQRCLQCGEHLRPQYTYDGHTCCGAYGSSTLPTVAMLAMAIYRLRGHLRQQYTTHCGYADYGCSY